MYFPEVPLNEQRLNEQSTNEDSNNFKGNLNIVLQYIRNIQISKAEWFLFGWNKMTTEPLRRQLLARTKNETQNLKYACKPLFSNVCGLIYLWDHTETGSSVFPPVMSRWFWLVWPSIRATIVWTRWGSIVRSTTLATTATSSFILWLLTIIPRSKWRTTAKSNRTH